MEAGEWQKAADMFEKILTYSDATALWRKCIASLGDEKMAEGDLTAAMGYYEKLPEDDAETQEKITECVYRMAMAAFEEGDLEKAQLLFAEVEEYSDSDKYIRGILYARATAAMNEQDYDLAIDLFTQAGDYEDSEAELTRARYAKALDLIDNGDYAEAIPLLELTPGYLNADSAIRDARYRAALQLMQAKDFEKAAEIFGEILNYKDSRTQYKECLYIVGKAALENGDEDKGLEYLSKIGDYKDVKTLFSAAGYERAMVLKDSGDYREAVELFRSLGGYLDSAAQAEECLDLYYEAAYEEAAAAYEAKEYAAVVAMLRDMDLSYLPERYEDLKDMYAEAAYRRGDELYAEKRPYEALAYYDLIPGYKDVKTKKLTRTCYQIIGSWETADGETRFDFRADGTFKTGDREEYYYTTQYAVYAGGENDPVKMTYAYNILDLRSGQILNLRDEKTGAVYKMKPVKTD